MKAPLTQKKAAWAKQFKPQLMKGLPIPVNAGVQEWYAGKMETLVTAMHQEYKRRLLELFKAEGQQLGYSQDASLASQARILLNKLHRNFGSVFEKKAVSFAEGMLRRTNKENASTVHASLKELSGGLAIKTGNISGKMRELLKAAVEENVSYIGSIQAKYHADLSGAVMRSITTGNGLADLVPAIEKLGVDTKSRAHAIALDQSRRANAFMARQRMQDSGLTHFRWRHTGRPKKPREYHRDVLDGQVFEYANPPIIDPKTGQRGFPGDLPGCTCEEEAVIVLGDGEYL